MKEVIDTYSGRLNCQFFLFGWTTQIVATVFNFGIIGVCTRLRWSFWMDGEEQKNQRFCWCGQMWRTLLDETRQIDNPKTGYLERLSIFSTVKKRKYCSWTEKWKPVDTIQDKTLSLTSFSKQRKKKREGECLPLYGINRFSRLGQSFHVSVQKQ